MATTAEEVIPLESYAAVIAGLGAGLPLLRALDLADVRPFEWDLASDHWRAGIDESAASDLSLLVAFDIALLSAKRRFEPTVEPIESDLRAWAHFRRHFVTAVEPIVFLERHGISLSTYARIEGDWANRTLSDKELATKLQKQMEGPLEDCPSITLTHSALLVPRSAEATPHVSHALADAVMPSVTVESSFLANVMSQAAVALPIVPSVPIVAQVPLAVEDDAASMTLFLPAGPICGPALPFDSHGKPKDLLGVDVQSPVLPLAESADPGKTQDWSAISETMKRQIAIMPFESPLAAKRMDVPAASVLAHSQQTIAANVQPSFDETLDFTQFVTSNTLRQAALPFDPAISFEKAATGTAPSVAPQPASVAQVQAAQVPRTSEPPVLTLERYASLCVEFTVAPTQTREIAARYGVTEEQWAKVDVYWRARMGSEPEIRAAWEWACVTYRQWLLRS